MAGTTAQLSISPPTVPIRSRALHSASPEYTHFRVIPLAAPRTAHDTRPGASPRPTLFPIHPMQAFKRFSI
jgi:hypothetical protein